MYVGIIDHRARIELSLTIVEYVVLDYIHMCCERHGACHSTNYEIANVLKIAPGAVGRIIRKNTDVFVQTGRWGRYKWVTEEWKNHAYTYINAKK